MMYFSLIIPVFNRPDEVKELLESLVNSDYKEEFEVVIVEDGSTLPCEKVIDLYKKKLNISYYLKYNSGPGDSRNFGMNLARGDYFLIFDSDCIIPNNYLTEVSKQLNLHFEALRFHFEWRFQLLYLHQLRVMRQAWFQ